MQSSITPSQLEDLRHIVLKNNKEKILEKFVLFIDKLSTEYMDELVKKEVEKILDEKEIQDAKDAAICPRCGSDKKKRAGYNVSSDKTSKKQRYMCKDCNHKYCPDAKEHTPMDTKLKAVEYIVSKTSKRRTAKIMGVAEGTIYNWIRDVYNYLTDKLDIRQLVTDEELERVEQIEIDEMHHKHIKKNSKYGFGRSWIKVLER